MNSLRYSLAGLFVILVLFFNIERLDVLGNNAINLHTFVYAIAILSVLTIVGIPFLRDLPSPLLISSIIVIVLIGKLLIFNNRPIIGDIYTYLTIAEISFLAAIAYFSQQVAKSLQQISEDLTNARIVARYSQLRSTEESTDQIRSEITRSRHYERPMSVLVVEIETLSIDAAFTRIVQDLQRNIVERYTRNLLAEAASKQLRVMDVVMEDTGTGRMVIMCPEVDQDNASLLVDRIKNEAIQKLGIIVSVGAASFPQQGLTFEGLVDTASEQLEAKRSNAIELLDIDLDALQASLNAGDVTTGD